MDNTEKESVLVGALGEKAGLSPGGAGACFISRSVQKLPWKIIKLHMNILKFLLKYNIFVKKSWKVSIRDTPFKFVL